MLPKSAPAEYVVDFCVQFAVAGKVVCRHRESGIRTGEAGGANGSGRHRTRPPAPGGPTQVPSSVSDLRWNS
jgi:hypothetical protein